MNYTTIKNNQTIPLSSIPELEYNDFFQLNVFTFLNEEQNHCVNYFGIPSQNNIKLFCCIANDKTSEIYVSSCLINPLKEYIAFTSVKNVFEKFEREIHEIFGVIYSKHPWLKPVRYSHQRLNQKDNISNYPFFNSKSIELHEVGVGPIHAGVIEPGHFRFICNGEQIIHLEIQLGYQHRGIESLFIEKKQLLQRITLAESIAGDTVVGHTVCFVNLWESLCEFIPDKNIMISRTIALELERIAIHTGDLSALSTDIAYQLGSSVFGRLRTPIINFFQEWCGNRLAKGLIRAGKSNYPFTIELAQRLTIVLNSFEIDFEEMCEEFFHLPSVLARFEKTGEVRKNKIIETGLVGMAAKAGGVARDIRASHPHDLYTELKHVPVVKNHGDVFSRAQIRKEEIRQSIKYIRKLLENMPNQNFAGKLNKTKSDSFVLSLTEGWRGEICHCAITDDKGELLQYKIKDPSFHNWLALALSVRNNEISDFPVCNKSFNLSYCGHDL